MDEQQKEIIEKHPFMKTVLLPQLDTAKTLLECLENRLTMVALTYDSMTPYEKNEWIIKKIQTQDEVTVLKRVVSYKQKYFINFMSKFIIDLREAELNYDAIIAKAKNKASNDKEIALHLKNVDWESIEQHKNLQAKVELYQRLKERLK